MDKKHKTKVEKLSQQVRGFYAQQKPFRVFHGSTNSTRILEFKRDELVDTSDLLTLIKLDRVHKTVIVESNMPMDTLVRTTLKHGLVPPVVPEFPGITVGGAIQGGAGESSSFKWGFFSQTVNWFEMILPDGDVVTCSPSSHSDLFYGSAGSMGTLGIITAVEIQLVEAKPYVELTFTPVHSFGTAMKTLVEATKKSHDFVDAIMFSQELGVIITGSFTQKKKGPLRRFSRAHDEWFYLHAENITSRKVGHTETVPIKDYLFRFDRGAFWVGRFAFERFGIPYNRVSRFILNPLLHTRELYKALQESGASQEHIVQDLTVPVDKSVDFLQYIDSTMSIYPLWLCPVKPAPKSPLLCNGLATTMTINVGIWGPRMENHKAFVDANKQLENKLYEYNGKKWLYAHAYYTEDEFWKIYDKNWYDILRIKYKADYLPSIYEKTHVHKTYAINARRGLLNTMFGRAKLRVNK
ncbi:MAG: FAD-binding oxidoreductase [Candidatus Saccharimonadales bacterium]